MIEKKNSSEDNLNSLNQEEKLIKLMNLYGNDVLKLSFLYLKNKQLAEDVTQDVFLKCYENLVFFRGESSYKTWIYKITVNRCKDLLKGWSYRNILLKEFIFFNNVTKINNFYSSDNSEYLSQIVPILPLKQREVIILHYYQELSVDEIAKILEVNNNTVKTRLHRGRNKLKKLFNERVLNNGG